MAFPNLQIVSGEAVDVCVVVDEYQRSQPVQETIARIFGAPYEKLGGKRFTLLPAPGIEAFFLMCVNE